MTQQREPHPNAEVIIAWALGKPVQFRTAGNGGWIDWLPGHNVFPHQDRDLDFAGTLEWRIKPEATPCEELGYEIGDKFLACLKDERFNMIAELMYDDNSRIPLFKVLVSFGEQNVLGKETYISLDNVKKIDAEIFK